MSKYGTAHYGVNKYGNYQLVTDTHMFQGQRFRFSTINHSLWKSPFIVNQFVDMPGSVSNARIRSGNSMQWTRLMNVEVPGTPGRIRITSFTGGESICVVSETAIVRQGLIS